LNLDAIRARILGGCTLDDVRNAFNGTHPDEQRYTWRARVHQRNDIILIDGYVYHDGIEVGGFKRRLTYERGARRARHVMIELDALHQDKDVAKHHYRQALRFYMRCGIRFVQLDADVDGPAVWPQFAFDLAHPNHKSMLLRIMKEHEVANCPSDPRDLFAPDVAAIEDPVDPVDEEPLGLRMFKELRVRAGRPLPMILDLEDPDQLALLRAGSIIGP
jgi:hypothetical protein